MAKRISKPIITGVTRQQAEDAMTAYADTQAAIARITAEVEQECIRIRDSRAKEISDLQLRAAESQAVLEAYARENRDTIFQRRRSLDLPNGTIGFRTATPKLKTLKGFTWASALQLAKKFLPMTYIRQTEEIAKDRLLADREMSEVAVYDTPTGDMRTVSMKEAMAVCGLQVTQDETFFISLPEEKLA